MESCISATNLTKRYGSIVALNNLNLEIPTGGVVGLLGTNGSGKSTFIKLAMGMLQPTSGEIYVCGEKPGIKSKAQTAYLPDVNFLTEWMKVEQMVGYCADFFADFSTEKAYSMLEKLGVDRKQVIRTLSKGNKEKLGLILTMARNARLYILDEPIAGVDPAARDFILQTALVNRTEGSTILLCTHLIYDVQDVLTQAIFLNRGVITLNASVKELCEKQGKTLDMIFRETFRW